MTQCCMEARVYYDVISTSLQLVGKPQTSQPEDSSGSHTDIPNLSAIMQEAYALDQIRECVIAMVIRKMKHSGRYRTRCSLANVEFISPI